MRNPYNEYAKCAGCFGEIYPGETYLGFIQTDAAGEAFQRVHDEFGCLYNAVDAVEVSDRPKGELYCAGCGLEILPEHKEHLLIMRNGKEVRIHNDFNCLQNVVGTQRFEAVETKPRYRTAGYEY